MMFYFNQEDAAGTAQELQRQLDIVKLAIPLEDELSGRIDEMLAHLATEQGFTYAGIARLLVDCQRRMAADWQEVGVLRRECNALKAAALPADAAGTAQEPTI